MIIVLHRWQPSADSKRWRRQTFEISSQDTELPPGLDIILTRGIEFMHKDPRSGIKQVVMRTQKIDRIVFDPYHDTVEIWTSPTDVRQYTRKMDEEVVKESGVLGLLMKVRKKAQTKPVCECHHLVEMHASHGTRPCLNPGCFCTALDEKPLPKRRRKPEPDRPLDLDETGS